MSGTGTRLAASGVQGSLLELLDEGAPAPGRLAPERLGLAHGAWVDVQRGWLSGSQELFDRLRKDQEAESRLTVLTPQERKVLELIAQGQSNRQIAEQLFLAEATVKNYVSSLLSKLGMRRRTEAAVYAAVLAERKGGGSRP